MKRIYSLLIFLTTFILSNLIVFAQSITWLDSSAFPFSRAYDLSDDGNVVVGDYYVANPLAHHQAFGWTKNYGFIDIGTLGGLNTHAYGVSTDGSIITGNAQDNINNQIGRAFYRTDTSGIIDIGTLGGDAAIAHDISSDGNVIVGASEDGTCGSLMAFRWVKNIGMDNLGSFCNCCVSSATAVSSDGNVVVGYAEYNTYHTAFIWTPQSGLQNLGRLGGLQSEALGVSGNGSIIVGWTDVDHPNGTRTHAFFWSSKTGMVDIHNDSAGTGSFYSAFSRAYSVSDDGRKVVGDILLGGNLTKAFLWTEEKGMQSLTKLYSNLLAYGSELISAKKISPDGRFIIGWGYNSATLKWSAYILDTGSTAKVEENNYQLPKEFYLSQNYPNPFNPSTKIRYQIPLSSPLLKGEGAAGGFVTLKVYDILSNEIATLVNEEKPAGRYEVEFSAGSFGNGNNLASGIYLCRMQAGNYVNIKKMMLLK
jgi:probable HAF family extracellular repeat protein